MMTEPSARDEERNPERSHFLRLPADVRDRIYTGAKVIGWDGCAFINLNQYGKEWPPTYQLKRSSAVTLALLLSCRTIYNELNARIYGDNHFSIHCDDFKDLQLLRRLSTASMRAMTKLTIHLNAATCELGDICHSVSYWLYGFKLKHQRSRSTLSIQEPAVRTALLEWHHIWSDHIRPNIVKPSRLQIHVICDVLDLETGLMAVQPFLNEAQGLLAGCSIRLSSRKDADLQKLAEKTVIHATVPNQARDLLSKSSIPFRFLDLPIELQQHILSYTDLVSPSREIEWSPLRGMRFRYRWPLDSRSAEAEHMHMRPIEMQFPNGDRTILETSYFGCWEFSYPSGCYCRTSHSAYSTVYACRCWAPPTPIFLVSRVVRKLALEIFFSRNRIIVTPGTGATWECATKAPDRLHASQFLRDIVPAEALHSLRELEIVFPPFGHRYAVDYCPPTSPAWSDWVQTLDYIKDKLNIPNLTLRIYFASWLPTEGSDNVPRYRAWMTNSDSPREIRNITKSYLDVIMPLKRFRGLKACFAHLPSPTEYAEDPLIHWIYRGTELTQRWAEDEAERVVMGWEYAAVTAGKYRMEESVWSERHRAERCSLI